MIKNKEFKKCLVVGIVVVILLTVFGFSGCVRQIGYKHVTHLGVGLSVLEKDSVKDFYRARSATQKALAEQCLDIIYKEYEICSDTLNLPIQKLNPCSLVFCKSNFDLYVVRCHWFSYVDGVQCWPIIGEDNLTFKKPINVYLLYQMLPHEISDTTLRRRGVNPNYGGWFIEGVSEYIMLNCTKFYDQLNNSFWLNMIDMQLTSLSDQEERIVDLSDRSSFAGYGAPGSADCWVFYVGSLAYVNYLVDEYGDDFISDVVANNCKSYEEIRSVIENSTGYNIDDSIKNVSVGWIKEQYILLLQELNVNIPEY